MKNIWQLNFLFYNFLINWIWNSSFLLAFLLFVFQFPEKRIWILKKKIQTPLFFPLQRKTILIWNQFLQFRGNK